MKPWLIIFLAPGLLIAAPSPTPVPKGVIVKQGMVCRTKQQDLELRDWIAGIMNEAHKAQADAKSAQESNANVQLQLDGARKAATDLANECAADKKCAEAPLSCWFHRLLRHILWISAGLIVVLIAVTILAPGVVPVVTGFFGLIGSRILGLFTRKPPL